MMSSSSARRSRISLTTTDDVPEDPGIQPDTQPAEVSTIPEEVRYPGHIVSPEGMTSDTEKLEAKSSPQPRDKHELRSLLRPRTENRRFIVRFANIAKPLTQISE
jgi:hypothetical protein